MSLEPFLEAIKDNRDLFRRLYSYLTIHVTEFFRDPPYWEAFRAAMAVRPPGLISIWSAGCSWGAEPVTAAVILEDLGRSFEVLATDSDEMVLDDARGGRFAAVDVDKVPARYRHYFRPEGPDHLRLVLQRGRITYLRHDLVVEPPPGRFDVVICRNLIIYFRPLVRQKVLERLAGAVKPTGILFLGATETFLEYAQLGFVAASPALFYKEREPQKTIASRGGIG
jgi:chemotaxis protein methyltransferase CheR